MTLIDKKTLSVLLTIMAVAGVLAIMYAARRTLVAFVLALLFAYLLEPLVARLQPAVRGSRLAAIAVTYVVLLGVIGGFVALAGPNIVEQGQKLGQALPGMLEKVGSGQVAFQIGAKRGWSYETQVRAQQFLVSHQKQLTHVLQSQGTRLGELATNVGWVLLVPIFALFFLKDKASFGAAALRSIENREGRGFLRGVLDDLDLMLASYIRAQLMLAVLALIAYTIFLRALAVPYAFALGAVGGLLEFIPFVGPLTAAVLFTGVALLTGYQHWYVLPIFAAVWRLIQDYVTMPYLMGRGLEMHPLLAIFAILVGGEVAGVVGMLISIPVVAAIRIVWQNWRQQRERDVVRPVSEITTRVA